MLPWAALADAKKLEKLNIEATYQIRWNGIGIGRIILNIKESDDGYMASVDTKTRGIIDIFSPLRGFTQVSGRITEEGAYLPTHYESRSQSDDGGRTTSLAYDSDGELSKRLREPLDDPSWRPEVPLEEIVGVADPITAFLRLRSALFQNLQAKVKDTIVPAYDGRRYAEIRVRAINPGTKMLKGKVTPMINTVLFRKPINGYTPKELAKFDKGDPTVHVYFSHDMELMPLALDIDLPYGMITAEREKK
jgi:hypothetical protein